jgi:hypothetical protein
VTIIAVTLIAPTATARHAITNAVGQVEAIM